jgi:hypothetical protein
MGKAPWEWTDEQQEAFEKLKTLVTTAPVLTMPNDEDKYKVETDASQYAIGAVLSQHQNGKWRPIAFLSKSLNPAECNYEIYDQEMLTIMKALTEWKRYLKGTKQIFEVHSDHQNLQYF